MIHWVARFCLQDKNILKYTPKILHFNVIGLKLEIRIISSRYFHASHFSFWLTRFGDMVKKTFFCQVELKTSSFRRVLHFFELLCWEWSVPRSVFHQKKQLLGEAWFHRYRYSITVRFFLWPASRLSRTSFQLTNNHRLWSQTSPWWNQG